MQYVYAYCNPKVSCTVHHESCIVHCNSGPGDTQQLSPTSIRGNGEGGWQNGPQTYLIVVAHVSIQLVHVMRTLRKSRTGKHQVCEVFSSVLIFVYYLTGVPGAGFWNVAIVHSVSTHHAPQLILWKGELWMSGLKTK